MYNIQPIIFELEIFLGYIAITGQSKAEEISPLVIQGMVGSYFCH